MIKIIEKYNFEEKYSEERYYDELLEDDEITAEEQSFMQGYLQDQDETMRAEI